MSAVTSAHAGERSDTDAVAETPAEPVQTVTAEESIAESSAEIPDDRPAADDTENNVTVKTRRRIRWSRVIAYRLLPGLALLLACAAVFLKWQDASVHDTAAARAQSVQAATEGTIALLSYRPDTVQQDLEAARSRLTGSFLNAYTSLTPEVVIPGAKHKQISAVASVPAAASMSATADHAVVLLFVNQSVIVGQDAPTSTASSVRVTLDKIDGHWLISKFDPV